MRHLAGYISAHGRTFPKKEAVGVGQEQGSFTTPCSDLPVQPVLDGITVSRQTNPCEEFEQVISGAMLAGNCVNEDIAQRRLNNVP